MEWEHVNWHELDGTPDDDFMTSVDTDGIEGTSPSVKAEDYQSANYLDYDDDDETSSVTSLNSSL